MTSPSSRIRIAVLGAGGYTGAELLRLLAGHPRAHIAALTGDTQAGRKLGEALPHLAHLGLPDLARTEEVDFAAVELVFCCLPHGTTQEILAGLPAHVRIVDLSADFRLRDLEAYARVYGHPHRAPALQKDAVYGLTEHRRAEIARARLVANPGCYPTATLLPLLPLLQEGRVLPDGIVVDAKSGVTGAGRAAKRNLLFCEVSEGMSAYATSTHRHVPEIEQELALAADTSVAVDFTAHLIPMRRGMIATIYAALPRGVDDGALRSCLEAAYRDAPFVDILPAGAYPSTHATRGSNRCQIAVFPGRKEGRAVLISAIDNLTKGASGQAVQNMNVMFGFPETTGLDGAALFP